MRSRRPNPVTSQTESQPVDTCVDVCCCTGGRRCSDWLPARFANWTEPRLFNFQQEHRNLNHNQRPTSRHAYENDVIKLNNIFTRKGRQEDLQPLLAGCLNRVCVQQIKEARRQQNVFLFT